MKRILPLSLLLPLAACNDGSSAPPLANTTVSFALDQAGLTTLSSAVIAADLQETLADSSQAFTVFGPTNEAFAKLDPAVLASLLEPANQAALADILLYHTLGTEAFASTASSLTAATTLNTGELIVDSIGGELYINEARVVETDIDVANGVIHKLDTVLSPPQSVVDTLVARGFGTLVAAVQAGDLVGSLSGPGPFTILAPTDAAFAALPAGTLESLLLPENQATLVDILTYHVVPASVRASDALAVETAGSLNGRNVLFAMSEGAPQVPQVNGVAISTINIPCTNGVIHVIDEVLIPPASISTLAADLGFDTLVTALQAAELDTAFDGDGTFTVFAPTDAAFAALDPALLGTLLEPANQASLIQILQYHVSPSILTAKSVLGSTAIPTLEGNTITVQLDPARVNDSELVVTDVLARNGIVHAINAVLIPPGFAIPLRPAPAARIDAPVASNLRNLPAAQENAQRVAWPNLAPIDGKNELRLVVETPGAQSTESGISFPDLDARLRVDADLDQLPGAITVDVDGTGFDTNNISLLFHDGVELQRLEPDALELGNGFFRATWTPYAGGQDIDGFDIALTGDNEARLDRLVVTYQD